MGIFGGSYPPGCSGTPYDEADDYDLSQLVSEKIGVPCAAFWDEDGNLIAGIIPPPAPPVVAAIIDPDDPFPAGYQEPWQPLKVGKWDWDDELSEGSNVERAATVCARLLGHPLKRDPMPR